MEAFAYLGIIQVFFCSNLPSPVAQAIIGAMDDQERFRHTFQQYYQRYYQQFCQLRTSLDFIIINF